MSINLHIAIDGEEIDIYQTPSYITYMCMMTQDGWTMRLKGKQAQRAVRSYLAWVSHAHPLGEGDTKRLFYAVESGIKLEVFVL
jgi:hypothetical protein